MKKFSLRRPVSVGKLCYHFFAVVGMISSFALMISWVSDRTPSVDPLPSAGTKDVNVSTAEAAASVEAYKWRVSKDQTGMPKGYFMSRESLMWLLQDPNNNGIYFYPGFNGAGRFCMIAEGGRSDNAGQRIVDGIDGRRMMSESLCPTDCGSLAR